MFLGLWSRLCSMMSLLKVPKLPLTPKRTKKTLFPTYWCFIVYRNWLLIFFFFFGCCLSQYLYMWEAVEMSICLQYILVAAVLVCGSCPWFATLHFYLLIRLVTHWNALLQKLSFPFSSPWKHTQWFNFHPQFSNSIFFPKFLKNRSGRILVKASGKEHFDGD